MLKSKRYCLCRVSAGYFPKTLQNPASGFPVSIFPLAGASESPPHYLISTLIIPSETQCKHRQQTALDDNFLAK